MYVCLILVWVLFRGTLTVFMYLCMVELVYCNFMDTEDFFVCVRQTVRIRIRPSIKPDPDTS